MFIPNSPFEPNAFGFKLIGIFVNSHPFSIGGGWKRDPLRFETKSLTDLRRKHRMVLDQFLRSALQILNLGQVNVLHSHQSVRHRSVLREVEYHWRLFVLLLRAVSGGTCMDLVCL